MSKAWSRYQSEISRNSQAIVRVSASPLSKIEATSWVWVETVTWSGFNFKSHSGCWVRTGQKRGKDRNKKLGRKPLQWCRWEAMVHWSSGETWVYFMIDKQGLPFGSGLWDREESRVFILSNWKNRCSCQLKWVEWVWVEGSETTFTHVCLEIRHSSGGGREREIKKVS